MGRWNPGTLSLVLRRIGVYPLHVAPDHRNPRRLVVYLIGPDGRSKQDLAVNHLRGLEGIGDVEVSEQAWTILRVDIDRE